jgi:hypothetical protein
VESCFDKLYQLLQSSAKEVIPGETSQAQRNRVQKLYVYSPWQKLSKSNPKKNIDKKLKMKVALKTKNSTAIRKVVAGGANTMTDINAKPDSIGTSSPVDPEF